MKQYASAASRNRQPIAETLRRHLPASGTVLETASGTGQHIAYFAHQFPDLMWQPSDVAPSALASIRAWRDEANLPNLLPPLTLDVVAPTWPIAQADVVININMIHISAWASCVGLMRGAGRLLSPGGILYMYGPYFVRGQPTAPSNEAFHVSLHSQNPDWGLRHVHTVEAEAEACGLSLRSISDMPKNNLSLIFAREPQS